MRKAKQLGVPVETLFAQDAAAAEKVAEGETEEQARAEAQAEATAAASQDSQN